MTQTTPSPFPGQVPSPLSEIKLGLVHEWLTDWGGSEAVTAELLGLHPGAKLYALFEFLKNQDRQKLGERVIGKTFLQNLPGMHERFWYWLWLMPTAIESLDLREHELILSSSHAFAKGVLTHSDQLHISYVHSPMRYAWDMYHEYLHDYGLDRGLRGLLARRMFGRLRQWDRQTANNVDLFIANSAYVARRIWRAYRRPAVVIHPPVDIERIPVIERKENFYLTVSRLVSYKRVDLIVEAFRATPERKLLVVGDGPELNRLKQMASPNIEFLGHRPDHEVQSLLGRAQAFVFAAREDFGITPVEAQAAGTPVIAFGAGGALETIVPAAQGNAGTGIFYPEQTPQSLIAGLQQFESIRDQFTAVRCRAQAERFSRQVFRTRMEKTIIAATERWRAGAMPEELIHDHQRFDS